jgi:hypothetical protein
MELWARATDKANAPPAPEDAEAERRRRETPEKVLQLSSASRRPRTVTADMAQKLHRSRHEAAWTVARERRAWRSRRCAVRV